MAGASMCKYCTKSIRWVETEKGRRMPLNPDPDPNGNVVMRDNVAHVLTAEESARLGPQGRWMPHTVTCSARIKSRAKVKAK